MTTMYNPPHPGEIIKSCYLEVLNISGRDLAYQVHVAPSTMSRVINGTAKVTPEMALRLSKALGRSPKSWLNLQDNYDLFHAEQKLSLDNITRVKVPA